MPQPELATVNLNDVVRGIVKLFEAQFGAVGRPPITSELHLEENLPTIQADAALLHRAIENLVLNAMDAMPAGGVLMLRTTHSEGHVDLEVSDTGTGLTPEECERLFTPYYTTKQHGTGLGLAIVQSVVSDHGGRISVESETGVGTSFHIDLPVKPPLRPRGRRLILYLLRSRLRRLSRCRLRRQWLTKAENPSQSWRRGGVATRAAESPHPHPHHRRRREYARVACSRISFGGTRSHRLR